MEIYFITSFAVLILSISGMWKVFEKSNLPGWGTLIPIYNIILLLRVAKISPMFFIFLMIPIINIFALFLIYFVIAERFGKNTIFGIGLIFFGFVFYPILGFGKAKYIDKLEVKFWYKIADELTHHLCPNLQIHPYDSKLLNHCLLWCNTQVLKYRDKFS